MIFWSFVTGPLGAVLAIPLTLLTKALLLDVDPTTRSISVLLTCGSAADTDTDDAPTTAHPDPKAAPTGTGPDGDGLKPQPED
jgi:AI-2 transport protein TqsA